MQESAIESYILDIETKIRRCKNSLAEGKTLEGKMLQSNYSGQDRVVSGDQSGINEIWTPEYEEKGKEGANTMNFIKAKPDRPLCS